MVLDGKKDAHLGGASTGTVSRLEVIEGPTGRRVRSEAERARIVAESLLPGATDIRGGAQTWGERWQIYDWRRHFRQRGALPSREGPAASFAPLVVDAAVEADPSQAGRWYRAAQTHPHAGALCGRASGL